MKKTTIFILCFVLCGSVYAASFDCSKANKKIEKAICGNKELSTLDGTLGNLYAELKKMLQKDSFHVIKMEQSYWLDIRNRNDNIPKLISLYNQRIMDLKLKNSLLKDSNSKHIGKYIYIHEIRFLYGDVNKPDTTLDDLDLELIDKKQLQFGVGLTGTNANTCGTGGVAVLKGDYYEWVDTDSGCTLKIKITTENVTINGSGDCTKGCGAGLILDGIIFSKLQAVSKDINDVWR